MAVITNPSLTIKKVDNKPLMRNAAVSCRISFEDDEIGQLFKLNIDLFGADKGLNFKDNILFKMVNNKIIEGSESAIIFEESRRVACTVLDEDSNGKDEIYAQIDISPKGDYFGADSNILSFQFEN